MDAIEKFLQFKIFGVDMIGIILVSIIAAVAWTCHQWDKGVAKSRWTTPVVCFVIGFFGLLTALVMYERQAKAVDVLKRWTKIDGLVTRMERLETRGRRGRINYTHRATVAFVGPDGKRKEGLLFHEQHAPGDRITIYYDSQKDYSPGAPAYNGARQIETPQSTQRETGWDLRLIGVTALLVGIGSWGFGSHRLISILKNERTAPALH